MTIIFTSSAPGTTAAPPVTTAAPSGRMGWDWVRNGRQDTATTATVAATTAAPPQYRWQVVYKFLPN